MSAEEEARQLKWRAKRLRRIVGWTDNQAFKEMLLEEAERTEAEAEMMLATTLPPAAAVPSGEPSIAHAGAALKLEATPEPSEDDSKP